MKLHVLLAVVALHGTFYPRCQCRALNGSEVLRASLRLSESQRLVPPILVRLGEEYFMRLETPKQSLRSYPSRAGTVNHALRLKLTQRLLRGDVDDGFAEYEDPSERRRRADELPLSLDLTFLLLREVLEMARAQQLAQQASSNRKMMDFFGKK